MQAFKLTAFCLATCSSLSSCMLGPDFHSPAKPNINNYLASTLIKKTARGSYADKASQAQVFLPGHDVPLAWWTLFHSKAIDQLIRQGIAHNPTIVAAKAALLQAQEMVNVQVGNSLYPAINNSGYGERERFSTSAFGLGAGDPASARAIPTSTVFNLFNSTFNISYNLDIFGKSRREIEALRAQVNYQQYELQATYLTLTTDIVNTVVMIASYDAQIKATQALISFQQDLLNIFSSQYRLGGNARTNVLSQQALVAQTKASLPLLEKTLVTAKHRLAILVGELPEAPMPIVKLDKLTLPKHLPLSLPANLVRQRPDILASEALLHAASAQIGVATANLLPQINLTAAYGYTGNVLANLVNNQDKVWNLIGQYGQPIFQGGALLSQRRANIAAYQQAGANYKQTVLQAFQQVADVLRAIEQDAKALQAQEYAERAAKQSLLIYQSQVKLGGVSYINVLNAQQQYQQILISRIQAQATRYSDTVALFQSLGGGWWHQPLNNTDKRSDA